MGVTLRLYAATSVRLMVERIYVDQDTGEWVACLHGPGNPFIRAGSKTDLEDALDQIEQELLRIAGHTKKEDC